MVGGKRLTLEATLYRPARLGALQPRLDRRGNGRAPVTLRPGRQAQFFVERGFAVLAPMRRGRGASDGAPAE